MRAQEFYGIPKKKILEILLLWPGQNFEECSPNLNPEAEKM